MTTHHTRTVYIATIFSALGGLLFGYDTGVISSALLYLKTDFHLSSGSEELVVSAVLIGAIIGALIGGALADKLGRRRTIIACAALFILAAIETAFAYSITQLIIGRIITGIAVGVASLASPLYISEIAPPNIRGKLVGFNQLAVTSGILFAFIVSYGFSFTVGNWRWMFLFATVPAFVLGVGMYFLPPSPRWLMRQGKNKDAKKILESLRGTNDVDQELNDIRHAITQQSSGIKAIFKPNIRPLLFIGIALSIIQQITGINTIIYYAPTIFQMAVFHVKSQAIMATVFVGITNVAFTILSLLIIDRLGRRKLLLISVGGMIIALILLATAFLLPALKADIGIIAVLALLLYVAFFAIGLGPVFWLLITELYPLEIRGKCMSVASLFNWLFNLIIGSTLLTIVHSISLSGTFWLYAGISVFSWFYILKYVPETKGKSLEALQKELTA